MPKIEITYYSDVLCIWAYVAERRLEELVAAFGEQISIETRYCSVFPDAWGKIEKKGGFEAFNRHLQEVAGRFPHIVVRDDVWLAARPRTSASTHLFLKAVELIERAHDDVKKPLPYLDRLSTRAAREMRLAFFAEAQDISDWQVHRLRRRRSEDPLLRSSCPARGRLRSMPTEPYRRQPDLPDE
jgi:hypothetical protein